MNERKVDARKAIIGEPSEMKIVYANNGYLVIDFEIPYSPEELSSNKGHDQKGASTQEKVFHGKACHSSTPHLGDNAIHKLIDYLDKMPDGISIVRTKGGSSVNTVPDNAYVEVDANPAFSNEPKNGTISRRLVALTRELQTLNLEFTNFENKAFIPSHPTLNLGLLDTREDHLWLSISVRVTPQISEELLTSWIDRMKKAAEKIGGVCKPMRLSPAALTPLDSELVTGCLAISKKLGLPETPITKAGGTECSIYRKHGLDCIVVGPGVSIGNSHTANEYNLLSQLEKASEFYTEAVRRFCL